MGINTLTLSTGDAQPSRVYCENSEKQVRLRRAAKTLCALAVERNLPTFGVKPLRAWLDKRCEKKIAKWEPVPAPTEPLPWEHFKRMPKRLKGGRHHGVHVSSDMELPNVYSGGSCFLCTLAAASSTAEWCCSPRISTKGTPLKGSA